MFYLLLLFFQKAENNSLKKASWSKFCNTIFMFLLKIGSVEPADQQINLVSPKTKIDSVVDLWLLSFNFFSTSNKFPRFTRFRTNYVNRNAEYHRFN